MLSSNFGKRNGSSTANQWRASRCPEVRKGRQSNCHNQLETPLSDISGNITSAKSSKRTIEDFFKGQATKKRRQDGPEPTTPSATEEPQASTESLVDEDDDWAEDPDTPRDVDEDLGSSAELEQPVTEENGWIRIGPQPAGLGHDIHSAPMSKANSLLKRKLRISGQNSDAKVPGTDSASVEEGCQRLMRELVATLTEHTNGSVKRLCDYTGREMSWAPGPKTVSLEADGSLRYHAAPNAHLVMNGLNMVKRRYPIAILPLLAVILNANVDTQQSTIAWAFNALCNTASLHYSFKTVVSVKATRFKNWAAWDEAKQRAMLEALRTVRKTPTVDEVLSTPDQLFRVDAAPTQIRQSSLIDGENSRWERQYPVLLRIAARYELNRNDFEFYLTIPLTGLNKRVFYPFHVLSRPQAQTIGWNWYHLSRLAARMLNTMRKKCNKHAEAAGLGDKGMNEIRLVYWMVAHFSSQIQTIKKDMPTATREEIRFQILDRWGLPIVPWVQNVLCASLCKGPDHGIAMQFGITEPVGLESFDPVRHIDLSKCTITIDTIATNMGMWNHHRDSWPQIREILRAVPLRHPLWRIDDCAGNNIWGAMADPTINPTVPVAEFDVPLVPIDAWFQSSVLRPRCEPCNVEFQNLGLLVQHCRCTHSSVATPMQEPTSSEQDDIDAKYWRDGFTCSWPDCDRVMGSRQQLERHMRMHTNDRRFRCDWPGCDYATVDSSHLTTHKRIHTRDQRFACDSPGCDYVATNAQRLADHKISHTQDKPWACDYPGCDKKYARNAELTKHKKSHTGQAEFRCDEPGCNMVCTQAGNLRRHKDRRHPGWRERETTK
ncbi:hypothetical protein BGZ63DRAFT_407169 [Mariannaea sp. PMI_226]|nr:hypothetical protein BGZ63DRAFT_407169 [Mariannaea sp. PMI_226]